MSILKFLYHFRIFVFLYVLQERSGLAYILYYYSTIVDSYLRSRCVHFVFTKAVKQHESFFYHTATLACDRPSLGDYNYGISMSHFTNLLIFSQRENHRMLKC